jgi:hypothetical protein
MSGTRSQNARDAVYAMVDDARYRPFIIGYLLNCLDERHWESLVTAAVEFADGNVRRQAELKGRVEEMRNTRG